MSSYHTNNNMKLLPPLTCDEEKDILQKISNGDSEARNVLVERNLRLITYIMKKFDNTGIDSDDLFSLGAFGLIKAANTFKLDKNTKFATYSARCIENEILMHIRKIKPTMNEVHLEDPIGRDTEGQEIYLQDKLGEVDEYKIEQQDEFNELADAIHQLNSQQQRILILRFGLYSSNPLDQKSIGELMNLSQSYISRIEKRGLNEIRKKINQKNGVIMHEKIKNKTDKGENNLNNKKIEESRLTALCREYGCNQEAYAKIAEILDTSFGMIKTTVSRWQIKKKIEEMQNSEEKQDNPVITTKLADRKDLAHYFKNDEREYAKIGNLKIVDKPYTEDETCPQEEDVIAEKSSQAKLGGPVNLPTNLIPTQQNTSVKTSRLTVTSMQSSKRAYHVQDEEYFTIANLYDSHKNIDVEINDIDALIEELIEIKEITKK